MTTTDEKTRVRLTGRRGLLAAVPAMLGFHPQESLVMVCLSGTRRRVGPVVRVDLMDPSGPGGPESSTVAQLLLHARRHADEVALLCYTENSDRPVMFDQVMAGLETSGVVVVDAAFVRGDRVYAGRPGTRPPRAGRALADPAGGRVTRLPDDGDPQVQVMAAASALHGRGILANRQALHDSIAGPTGAEAATASAALDAAADGLLAVVGRKGPIDRGRLAQLAEQHVNRALVDVAGPQGVPGATSALIALLLCDIEIRDRVISTVVNDQESAWVPALIAVARATPDIDAAEVCAVLAVAAYRRGDGALAQVAIDRCLLGEPDHRLAHLMLGVMAAGLPPAELVCLAGRGDILGPLTDAGDLEKTMPDKKI